MPVNLKYFQKLPNSGDQFSRVVAEHYLKSEIVACDHLPLAKPNLILLGSILEWSDSMTYVCGAGLISSDSTLRHVPKAINCVRGPLTDFFYRGREYRLLDLTVIPVFWLPDFLIPGKHKFLYSWKIEFPILIKGIRQESIFGIGHHCNFIDGGTSCS